VGVGLTGYLWQQPSEDAVESAVGTARTAAERAVVPLLSYDYRSLDADQQAAHDVITSGYASRDYDDLFEVIRENAPATQTVVDVEVIASAVVRAGEDRSEILLFVNRPTTNKATTEPIVYKDQVTLTMERVGDEWLVDDLKTSPIGQ
jgi:Mce-associated membrane protein